MRIGYFTSIDAWGGSEIYLKALIDGCRARGHDTVLFGIEHTRLFDEMRNAGCECYAWRAAQETPAVCADAGHGETVGNSPESRLGVAGGFKRALLALTPDPVKLLAGSIREVRHLSRLFREHRVDVMHINVHGYETTGVACRCAGIPSVSMNLNLVPEEPYWIRRLFMKYSARAYTIATAQSPSCIGSWVQWSKLDPARTAHIWNGVDIERFTRCGEKRTSRVRDGTFRLVTVARLHPMKGNRFLVGAMALLKEEPIALDVIGDGPEWDLLNDMVERNQLHATVRLHGHVEDFDRFLEQADAFALASVSHESCPGVLPQAMAAGLPLVTSDFGPLPEVNLDGETGYVAVAEDAAALAEAIRRLASDPAKAEEMGARGRTRALEVFSSEKMVQDMIGVYERAIGLT